MSFAKYKKTIDVGDTAVLLLGYDNMLQLTIERDKIYQTKYGALRCNEILGTRYGRRVQCSKGWLYVLHATPELWTVTLPHRTQILYATDISMIVYQLDIKPGSVVIESGTQQLNKSQRQSMALTRYRVTHHCISQHTMH